MYHNLDPDPLVASKERVCERRIGKLKFDENEDEIHVQIDERLLF